MLAYLDHAATSPLRPEATAAMLPWFTEQFGNPSGAHGVARRARRAVEEAREIVAETTGVNPGGVVFTGSGTEAANLAVIGGFAAACGAAPSDGPAAVVISAVEHAAVAESAAALGRLGVEVRVAPVDADGVVVLDRLGALLDHRVRLVSVMLVNNEVGAVQPVAAVARLARRRAPAALVHTDAVQAFPWLDLRQVAAGVDLVSISAHKFGGPQGVGALLVRDGVGVEPVVHGGGQERERRSGTHNVAGIVGMAAAAAVTDTGRAAEVARIAPLRDRLVEGLLAAVPDAAETGARPTKVPGTAHLCFGGIESEALLVLLDDDGVCASAGSACASGAMEPGPTLLAMGIDEQLALGSLRLTLGSTTTDAEIDGALKAVPDAVARLRQG